MPDSIIQLRENGIYFLSGKIDAHTDLTPLLDTEKDPVILNLKGISKINSIGVRKWMECLKAIQLKGKKIEYLECSEQFLMQCNMLPSFTKDVKVRSFHVPYYCDECRNDYPHLLHTEEIDLKNIPVIPCPVCHADMILDDESILDFLET